MSEQLNIRNYALVTAAYWGFTLTDGALRMLVLLHFHSLGFSPLQIATLFLLYEFCGVVTNITGGWLGVRYGLRLTLLAGLGLQIVALMMLARVDTGWLPWMSVAYVMAAQALSGVAKDLTKMSSKSAIKHVVAMDAHSTLYKWVALLTGSKNALKGVGFFMGAALLTALGFANALYVMAGGLALILLGSVLSLPSDMGRAKKKVKFNAIFSKRPAINALSAARFFLFGSRDVWFAVGLPIFLSEGLGWSFNQVGAFMAVWVIGYGVIQSAAPVLTKRQGPPQGATARLLALLLAIIPVAIALALIARLDATFVVVGGLLIFGFVFALNSAVHSYLILAYSDGDKVSMDVGFYYMANAGGRLLGTVVSGLAYQLAGMQGCLWASAGFVLLAAILSYKLPVHHSDA